MTPTLKGHNMPPKELDDFLILDNDGKSTGRIKFTKFPFAKSKGVPAASPPNTPPKAPSYTNRKKAEINIFGNSAKGLLNTLSNNLLVRIPNWRANGAAGLFFII